MRILMRFLIVVAFAYVGIVAFKYGAQRKILFVNNDNGALAKANWKVVEGAQPLKIQTEDGERLAAWYKPPLLGKPVFLFFHGNAGGLHHFKWRWQRLNRHGAGLLVFSYRGYPGSTGSPSEAGLNRDALAMYAWLRKRHPAEQIVLHGFSLGTGVATTLATQVNAQALVLEAPYTATVDVAAVRYSLLPVRYLMSDQFLSRERIDRIRMPLLIAHGTRDSVVPFRQGRRLFARAVEPKEFVEMTGSDHNTLVRDGIYPHIWRFLAKHSSLDDSQLYSRN